MTEEIVTQATEMTEAPAEAAAVEEAVVEYSFKTPEGVSYNEDFINDFVAISKTAKLTNEQSQAVLDGIQPLFFDLTKRGTDMHVAQWHEQSMSDKEFGGDKIDQSIESAGKALETFASKEFLALMKESGIGEHPEIIRFLVRVGNALGEDRFVRSDNTPAAPVGANRYDAMYPNHPA